MELMAMRLKLTLGVLLVACGFAHAADKRDPRETRALFLKTIDRPKVPLAPEVRPWTTAGTLEQTRFSYASEAGQRVPGVMIRPKPKAGERQILPVVIVLHGTGDSKEGMEGLLREFAARSFLGVAIDGRYHGERARGTGSADP
jgi:dipeptidyl aminopeptidase/acylaminoacyl peptidase